MVDEFSKVNKLVNLLPIAPQDLHNKTLFDARNIPIISVKRYVNHIIRNIRLDTQFTTLPLFIVAYVYILRSGIKLNGHNVHHLIIVTLNLASKYLLDDPCDNAWFAKIGGIQLGQMNNYEMMFLNKIKWDLFVSYEKYNEIFQLINELND
jgi:hypothetical protein